MNEEERIEELEEHCRLLRMDLAGTNRVEQKIGPTPHLEEMRNMLLDQLSDILKELKELRERKKW